MSTRPTHKLTPSMEDVHRVLNIFTSSPEISHVSRPLQRTKSSTQLCSSPAYRKSIQSTIQKCTSPVTTPHMPNHLFHIPAWPRSSRPHPKPRRFTFAQRHIAKHDDNLLEPNPASFHGSWGRQPSVELHLPITARAFACEEVDDMSNISLSPAAISNTLSPMSAAIEALTNAAATLNVQSTITTIPTKSVEQSVPAKPVEQPARPLVQPTVATTTPTADTNTTPTAPARPSTPTATAIAPRPVVMPVIPSPIIESDTPPLTPMKYITLPNSPPPTLPPNSPTPVIIHIPASPSPAATRVPPCTPMNPIPMHHARMHTSSHILNRIAVSTAIKPLLHDKTLQTSLPPLHYQPHTPLHYQTSTPLHCLCSSSPCSHIIDINTTHGYLYPSPTYSELSSFRSNIPSPIVSEHITHTHHIYTTPTHSRSSSRRIYTTPTHSRSSSRCNDTPTHAVYPSSWFSWRGRSMSMDACSPHGTSIQSF